MTIPAPTRALAAILAATALAVGACGDDDDSAAPAPAEADADDAQAVSDADAAETLAVTAFDFGYRDLPSSVPAGTRIELANESSTELHELVAFRLADDEERSVEELLALPPEEMQSTLGEPATVLLAAPGSDETIAPIGDGTLSEPGRYAVLCLIPTGADPDEYLTAAATSDGPPDVAGGPPHIANGMFAELTVD